MKIKKINFKKYKILEDISIELEDKENHNIFPFISINGGGKSSLLQLVFVFLHCTFRENRQKYLKNFLKDFDLTGNFTSLVSFELEYNGETFTIEFIHHKNGYNNLNFNAIITEAQIHDRKRKNSSLYEDLNLLNQLENDFVQANIPASLVYRELRKFIDRQQDNQLMEMTRKDVEAAIKMIRRNIEKDVDDENELNELLLKAKTEKNNLLASLEEKGLRYAFHFNGNKNILLYKSTVSDEILKDFSDKLYLSTPITQVLHFLDDDKVSHLFKSQKYIYSSYENTVRECQHDLTGFFTYDFSTIELILEAFKKARDEDFRIAIETGEYGNQIKNTRAELGSMFSGKSIFVDKDLKGVSFKVNGSNRKLNPKDLSHGELKKLSIYIWLKAIVPDHSIILMDEVDMGLHPIWQQELYEDLQTWSKGSQFLLATHSPQLISRSFYKNLVVFKPTASGSSAEQFNEAPLESDLNTIVKTVMGGDYLPKELRELRKQYRSLFEQGKLDTEGAKKIKDMILMYESENSSFFQDIKFQQQFIRK